MYVDRDGNSIDMDEFARLRADDDYNTVAQTVLLVSTVWTGVDVHGDGEVFETMVFELDPATSRRRSIDRFTTRTSTQDQAMDHHFSTVYQLTGERKQRVSPWPAVATVAIVAALIAWLGWVWL